MCGPGAMVSVFMVQAPQVRNRRLRISESPLAKRCGPEDAICNDVRGVTELTSAPILQLISERFRSRAATSGHRTKLSPED
jgi:hypothetical protein